MFQGVIGFGVAGNFAGHLEQAGEASDFVKVAVSDARAPKGLFPFYVPGVSDSFLGVYPLSSERILVPAQGGNLQIEPEVALLVDVTYDGGRVVGLNPRRFGAYNDCSIRKPNARKISEKKNWGPESKGLAGNLIEIDRFSAGGVMDRYRLCCYLHRDGRLDTYGLDSPLLGYSYFYEQLIAWMIDKLNTQQDAGPLENLADLLALANHPAQAVISIGATKYTPFGETTFLQPDDQVWVVAYDQNQWDIATLETGMLRGSLVGGRGISVLRQTVVQAEN
ncbi:DUF5718 family protein [Acanthopleuribacter pedis]|uniref:Uncharacterized protein n=1 Tax=Acanthopleuribacter pedis TaxID=442870 RepID=A0A8J7QPV1_9BACT|nr:DUF5718 family protein [Acanthopleuribacter pedis]MBO1321925.1 hypothetical protein [Acanthopleuribacter pedis]